MLANEERKENGLRAKIAQRRYSLLQYSSLLAVTGLLLIGPFYIHSLDELLIFCGGWSNFVAFYAILRVFKETPEKRVRAVLAIQSFILILILGFDLDSWLGPKWLRVAVFIPILLMMVRIGRQVLRAKRVPDGQQSGQTTEELRATIEKLESAVDSMVPSLFLIVSMFIVLFIDSIVQKPWSGVNIFLSSRTGLPIPFIDARDQAYLNLLLIPLLYLVSDLLMSRASPIAKLSLPLDAVIFVVGLACCTCGLAYFRNGTSASARDPLNALFESGAAAAVLLLGNWTFSLYIERLKPKLESRTA